MGVLSIESSCYVLRTMCYVRTYLASRAMCHVLHANVLGVTCYVPRATCERAWRHVLCAACPCYVRAGPRPRFVLTTDCRSPTPNDDNVPPEGFPSRCAASHEPPGTLSGNLMQRA